MSLRLRGGDWLDTATRDTSRRDLLVSGGWIVADDGRDAREVDLGGTTLLFGLWDCHAHPGEALYAEGGGEFTETVPDRTIRAGENLRSAVAAGITGVRCVDDAADVDLAYADAVAAGRFDGPRVRGTGRAIRTTGGHGTFHPRRYLHAPGMHVVNGPDAAARAVRERVERGAHWIKVMLTGGLASEHETVDGQQFTNEELAVVVGTATQRRVPVTAHCGGASAAITFARLGGRCIEHGYALDEEAVDVMARYGTWLVPTIGVTHDPAFLAETDGWPGFSLERADASRERHGEALRMALDAGVRIAVGADLNPIGERLHAELRLLEQAGMPRLDVLHAATVGARELNGFGAESLPEPGAVADIIAVDGNPWEDPSVLARPVAVVVAGVLRDVR